MRTARRFILATFILTFLVILAGGVVRTTHSGMGCPDWPRCFGRWIPPTNASQLPANFESFLKKQDIDHTFNAFHTWVEYVNRLLGALLGLFALIQVALLARYRKENRTSFMLAIAFLVVVVLTGLFGAIVVKLNLAHASISVHLLFAIILTQLELALLLSFNNKLKKIPVQPHVQHLILGFLIILFTHSVLGTAVRMYVDDVSAAMHYEGRGEWLAALPVAFLIHRSFSWVVLAGAIFLWIRTAAVPALTKSILLVLGIVIFSMITGISLYYLNMPAFAQPAHLLLAAFAITATMAALLKTKRIM